MHRLQPARRGAHTSQVRVLRPLESYLLEAAAGTSERGRAPMERAASLAQWAFIENASTLTSAARHAYAASARAAPPHENASARGGVFSCAHAQESYLLEAVAGTSERGCAPRKRAVSLAQWASTEHASTPTSAARRAHGASARAAPPRKLLVGGCCRYVGARPCTDGEGRLTGTVGFHRECIDSNQRGAARTRRRRACCAP